MKKTSAKLVDWQKIHDVIHSPVESLGDFLWRLEEALYIYGSGIDSKEDH